MKADSTRHSIYALFVAAAMSVHAVPLQAKNSLEKYHEEITELSIDDNINSPEVPRRQIEQARETVTLLNTRLKNSGFATDQTERDGLVLMVTVPAADIFAPNDTTLMPSAARKLVTLCSPLKTPDHFKVLVAVHSDDTGSEEYLNNLTRARSEAIVRWMESQGYETAGVVPYGMGYDEPLTTDQTREARGRNRRIEFYYVPGPELISSLKQGRRFLIR